MLLNQEVEKPLQHEWYKRLFRTIHKPQENGNWENVQYSKLTNIYIIAYFVFFFLGDMAYYFI